MARFCSRDHADDSTDGRSLFLGCGLLAVLVVAAYVVPARVAGVELVLPLDDVYIHMQYAAQIARG